MHDLNTITRLNAEAHGKAITAWRREGKHVVTVKEGLHLLSGEPYPTREAALLASSAIPSEAGRTVSILDPLPGGPIGRRDQSEDRGRGYATTEDAIAALK